MGGGEGSLQSISCFFRLSLIPESMALITAAGKEGSKAFETAEHEEQMLTFFWLTAAKCFFVFFFDLFVLTSLSRLLKKKNETEKTPPQNATHSLTLSTGNLNERSATGVCFTRSPATGEKKLFGEFLVNAQGLFL